MSGNTLRIHGTGRVTHEITQFDYDNEGNASTVVNVLSIRVDGERQIPQSVRLNISREQAVALMHGAERDDILVFSGYPTADTWVTNDGRTQAQLIVDVDSLEIVPASDRSRKDLF